MVIGGTSSDKTPTVAGAAPAGDGTGPGCGGRTVLGTVSRRIGTVTTTAGPYSGDGGRVVGSRADAQQHPLVCDVGRRTHPTIKSHTEPRTVALSARASTGAATASRIREARVAPTPRAPGSPPLPGTVRGMTELSGEAPRVAHLAPGHHGGQRTDAVLGLHRQIDPPATELDQPVAEPLAVRGLIRPRRTGPVPVSNTSKVIRLRCRSNPPRSHRDLPEHPLGTTVLVPQTDAPVPRVPHMSPFRTYGSYRRPTSTAHCNSRVELRERDSSVSRWSSD
ncbi:MAG: hypothetical protein QOG20_5340 [Pseudonocardiales bacterium]|jgi:hypothetical protein|nr:hypothetical protein [Pseudonocardiales bacterium]